MKGAEGSSAGWFHASRTKKLYALITAFIAITSVSYFVLLSDRPTLRSPLSLHDAIGSTKNPAPHNGAWSCNRTHPSDLHPQRRGCSPRAFYELHDAEQGFSRERLCVPAGSRELKEGDWGHGSDIPLWKRNLGGQECEGTQEVYNKFGMEHLDFTNPLLVDSCSNLDPDPSQFKIPKIVHFVFGLQPNFGDFPFQFVHYMAIKMAHTSIKPDVIMLHYKYEPKGEWWERAKKLVKLVYVESVPTKIFGNPVENISHQADILRMQVVLKYGGIYLDSDMMVFRSLDPLLHHETVLGKEDEAGLCNAMIMAAPNATFMREWYNRYTTFNDLEWSEHSVKLPLRLASTPRDDICVMPRVSFFYPSYHRNHCEVSY
ncbi:hypothetical protein DFJ73DRAFT_299791 [Zopfochytrium polystomum]|nr:hypothetical protein DFJ73DRAFT_299791 [Zopfochytrium polystomum]